MGASLIFSSWSCLMLNWNLLLWTSQTTADAQVLVILLILVWMGSLAQGSEEPFLTCAHHPRDIFPCSGETWWLATIGLIQILMHKVVVQLQLWVMENPGSKHWKNLEHITEPLSRSLLVQDGNNQQANAGFGEASWLVRFLTSPNLWSPFTSNYILLQSQCWLMPECPILLVWFFKIQESCNCF